MNTDNTSNREAPNSCEVVSKYFTHNPGMEESSQKVKENHSTQKVKTKTSQTQKRPRKRPQGQKDIRTLIKKKKNELVSYSKDFELICKQSGIDVDPEQLQLAIALSKSLQDSETDVNGSKAAKNLTSNQRKGKIRTTLQEYGFKVPEVKINVSKKVKQYRKHYKLLLVSDNEKQQIVADKYAQILIKNISKGSVSDGNQCKFDNTNSVLYNLSTNITYKSIKNDDTFYIPDLIPKNFNERHVLLKDYSTIPGRPPSPKVDLPNVNFNSIECSEEELCEILSGSIDTAQSIVKRNFENITDKNYQTIKSKVVNIDVITSVGEHKTTNQNSINKQLFKEELVRTTSEKLQSTGKTRDFVVLAIGENTEKMSLPTNRSCSPDIFDDEVTIIMDSSKDIAMEEGATEKTMVREQNDIMDLTECVNIVNFNNTNLKQNSYLSQGNNKTTINPNDFMELTACVSASSQKILNDIQSADSKKENNRYNILEDKEHIDNMDLTQSSDSNNSLPVLGKDSSIKSLEDDTILMTDEDYCNINAGENPVELASKETEIIDLVMEQQSNPKQIYDIAERDAVINLVESPENKDKEHKEYEKNSISEELVFKDTDAVDLTQTSNFEDDLPCEPISGCSKTSVDIISNHNHQDDNVIQRLSEENLNCPKGITCNYDEASSPQANLDPNIGFDKSPDCPAFIPDYENYHAFDDPINDIPINPYEPDESDTENDNISIKNKNHEEMDLTQSSNSDDGSIIANENLYDSTGERTDARNGLLSDSSIQEDTVLLNEDSSMTNIDKNVLGRYDDINIEGINCSGETRGRASNLNEKSNRSNTGTVKESIFDCENDREFDNILGNASQTSRFYDVDEDERLANKNSFNSENVFENPIREIDLTQHSDSNEKVSSPKVLEIPHDIEDPHNEESHQNEIGEIDLTQHSSSEENEYRQRNELGKRNNISIDYDEEYIEANNENDCDIIFEAPKFGNKENGNCSKDDVSNSSQNSEVFEISDNEFNYSINQHERSNDLIRSNDTRFDIGGMSIINEFLNRKSASIATEKLNCSCSNNSTENSNQSCLAQGTENRDNIINITENTKSCAEVEIIKVSTPSRSKSDNVLFAQTPKHNDYIIKTDQVTPMPKYEIMSSPERNEELDKYGIKPLKRKRAIQLLTHIYNQTHPVMEIVSDPEAFASPSKIRKKNLTSFPRRTIVSQIDSEITENCIEFPGPSLEYPELLSQQSLSRKGMSKKSKSSPTKKLSPEYSNANKENKLYEETKLLPDIRDIECSSEEWVFQKREKAKVHSCRVPLHIAFHNYVSCRRGLREAILRYEPINIDDIHKGLVANGFRYNPKDLLKFMDKKCITVKTADNARNNKK